MFPKKQRLVVCLGMILFPLTQDGLFLLLWVGEIISSSGPTFYKIAKQTTGACRCFLISGERVRGHEEALDHSGGSL